MSADLTVFQQQVLTALAEGYAARQGMKDRIRALNEWEIARRSGLTQASYAEYLTHPTRDEVSDALGVLQRLGLASVWDHGAKYDTFVPTPAGTQTIVGAGEAQAAATAGFGFSNAPRIVGGESGEVGDESSNIAPGGQDALTDRLDEVIRLLRSIDAKLGGQ